MLNTTTSESNLSLVTSYETRALLHGKSSVSARLLESRGSHNGYVAEFRDSLTGELRLQLKTLRTPKLFSLLSDFCSGVVFDTVRLDAPDASRKWMKESTNMVSPVSEGQEVDVYLSKDDSGWKHLAARPRSSASGNRFAGFNIFIRDPVLAERMTHQMRSGAVHDMTPAPVANLELLAQENISFA
jgi:hypothetical protein